MSQLPRLLLCLIALATPLSAFAADGVFVFGGTRGVGLEIVNLLVAQHRPVTVLVRESSDLTGLNETGAATVTGDALDMASIESALKAGSFGAVISTLGGTPAAGYEVDSTGNINAAKASAAAGIERFILVSSIGVGDSSVAMPAPALKALKTVLEGKDQAEQYLRESSLRYTIIRPGNLTNKPASGKGYLSEDPSTSGIIPRAEVARLVVQALDDSQTELKTFAAIQ